MTAPNQEWLNAVHQAQQEAVQAVNTPVEVFYPTPGNWEILRRVMVDNRVDKKYWTVATMWVQAIVGARADGTLQNRPTRAELNHARDQRDRTAGSAMSNAGAKQSGAKGNALQEMFAQLDSTIKGLKNAAPTTEAKVTLPTVEKSYEEMDDSEKLAYRKLKPEHMRMWLRNRARYVHETTYPNPNA